MNYFLKQWRLTPCLTRFVLGRCWQWLMRLAGLAVLLLGIRFYPHPSLADRVGTSRAVYAKDGQLLRLTLAPDGQFRLWTAFDAISPELIDAVQLYEDRYFLWHIGINPFALVRSAYATATGQRRMGGSTLTMQLARRLYRIDSRTVWGKLQQTLAAIELELCYSKVAILEAYLNTVPYGGNIEGVGAATLIYFHKPVQHLTLPEALTLAVIPQNPTKRTAARGHNHALQLARQRLWQQWRVHSPKAARYDSDARLVLDTQGRQQLPFIAPHASERLLAQYPQLSEIHSTLDFKMQQTLERIIGQYVHEHSNIGLNNASALLLDTQTMSVKAVVGSGNYHDAAIAGQVNATLAKRSPGSTLKPFIYALALDQGILHPKTVLKDTPTAFGAFMPENFDGHFVGPLAAEDALIRSRNVPAVAVAAQLSKPNLYDFLKLAGVSRLQSEAHYGLALVLGGGEVSMEELASLYAMLNNGGILSPLQYMQPFLQTNSNPIPPPIPPVRLLSPEASFIALDMLRKTPRPDTTSPARPAIAWKTGTSWGFRDAWTAGIFGRYVLVVWVGNFDGSSNPAFIGIEAAAPLFLRIVDALRAERLELPPVAMVIPSNLRQIFVCAATGGLINDDDIINNNNINNNNINININNNNNINNIVPCPVSTKTWFIAGRSPITPHRLHRWVSINHQNGQLDCVNSATDKAILIEDWGSDMQALFAHTGLQRRSSRQLANTSTRQNCPATFILNDPNNHVAPVIHSPLRGVQYQLSSKTRQGNDPVVLRAEAGAGVQVLYWFANDAFIGKVAPGVGLAWLPPHEGEYVLRVVDDQGAAEVRHLSVGRLP